MKREQLDKINSLLNRIDEIEKILAVKSDKFYVLGNDGNQEPFQYRGESVNCITVQRQTLEPMLKECIIQAREELRVLGYEE